MQDEIISNYPNRGSRETGWYPVYSLIFGAKYPAKNVQVFSFISLNTQLYPQKGQKGIRSVYSGGNDGTNSHRFSAEIRMRPPDLFLSPGPEDEPGGGDGPGHCPVSPPFRERIQVHQRHAEFPVQQPHTGTAVRVLYPGDPPFPEMRLSPPLYDRTY
jgi:hypothetical protein